MAHYPSTLVALSGAIEATSLGIAYGGPVFAKAALRPALKEISDDKERGKLLEEACTRFAPIDLTAHLAFTASWLVCRSTLKMRRLSRETSQLVALKDVLIAGALVTGLANIVAARLMKRDFPEGVAIDACGNVAPDQEKAANYQRFFRFFGPLNLAFVSGALALGPAIAATAMMRRRRGLLVRIFG